MFLRLVYRVGSVLGGAPRVAWGLGARRSRFVRVGALAGGVLLALAVHSSAAVAAGWARGVQAPLPANAGSHQRAFVGSVWCLSAGNCTAVGYYTDSSHHGQGLLLRERSGRWAPGIEAALPANAASNPSVYLGSVSCASAGNCTAVGNYTDSSGRTQGLLLDQRSGRWARGMRAALPANAASKQGPGEFVFLDQVSCPSAGNCAAVGEYPDRSGNQRLVLLDQRSGRWARGVQAALPANASSGGFVNLGSVSCASAGNCAAVGYYTDSSGNQQGLLLDQRSGKWARGVEAALPANASSQPFGVQLLSVWCASAGNCTAVGNYNDGSGSSHGLLLDERSGRWTRGVEAALPANAASDPGVDLTAVSCPSAGNCTAVGDYIDSSGNEHGLLLAESSGRWTRGVQATLPANAANGFLYLGSVSCASAGNCAAVGYYTDSSGNQQGLLLDQRSGRWAQGVEAALPANAGFNPSVFLSSVSCPSAGNCTAVGSYTDSSSHQHGLLLGESAP